MSNFAARVSVAPVTNVQTTVQPKQENAKVAAAVVKGLDEIRVTSVRVDGLVSSVLLCLRMGVFYRLVSGTYWKEGRSAIQLGEGSRFFSFFLIFSCWNGVPRGQSEDQGIG